jgi:ribonuclease BN (tRNA processing enzyme)
MRIYLVGTGTGVPSLERNPACIYTEFAGKRAIFDSGPGTLKNILKFGADRLNLDFIFYTHLHLDHVADLASILFAARIPPDVRQKPLTVYGPSKLKDYYNKILELYGKTIYDNEYPLDVREIEEQRIDIAGHEISTAVLRHHGGGMGYRIVTPEGKVMVYSGDTGYCPAIVELSKGADILFLECSFPDDLKMEGHLTPSTAGKIAEEAKVKKLVLVHMYPICDKYDLEALCRKEYGGEVITGRDMMKLIM